MSKRVNAECLMGDTVCLQPVAEWEYMLHELRRFRLEFGKDAPDFKWRDPNADFSNQLSKWFYQQPDMFKQRLLTPDQARP